MPGRSGAGGAVPLERKSSVEDALAERRLDRVREDEVDPPSEEILQVELEIM
jgi:hypothetical protein